MASGGFCGCVTTIITHQKPSFDIVDICANFCSMPKQNRLLLLCLAFITLTLALWASPAFARKMSDEEVGCMLLKDSTHITFTDDGTSTQKSVHEFKILHQNAIEDFSKFQISYDVYVNSVPRIKAWIQTPAGDIVPVAEKDIVDESLAENDVGFNEQRTRYFPWPKLTVGTIMHVEYELTTKPEYPNTFSSRYNLYPGLAVKDLEFELTIPAFVTTSLHDITGFIKPFLHETTNGTQKIITVKAQDLQNSYYSQEKPSLIPNGKKVWLDITSFASWEEAGQGQIAGYNRVLNQPLPPELSKFFGEKPTQPLTQDEALKRLTSIMNTLIDNIRYFQDYRRVQGGFVPRDLAEIVRTGYGDCKDYATLVVLAARHLGLEAYPAVTTRSSYTPIPPTIPMSMSWTNHAIAYVVAPDHSIWWTDATNKRAPLGIIPRDIAGRFALVLSPTAKLASIPAIDPAKNISRQFWEYDLSQSPSLLYNLQMQFTQTSGWEEYIDTYNLPKDSLRDYLIEWVGAKSTDIDNYQVQDFHFSDVAPFDYTANISFSERNAISRSGDYKIIDTGLLPYGTSSITNVDPKDRVTDLNLGELKTSLISLKLKSGSYSKVIGKPFYCDVKSPWYDFKRENVANSSWWNPQYELRTTSVVKNERITVEEMQTPEFQKLQADLTDCTRNVNIIAE